MIFIYLYFTDHFQAKHFYQITKINSWRQITIPSRAMDTLRLYISNDIMVFELNYFGWRAEAKVHLPTGFLAGLSHFGTHSCRGWSHVEYSFNWLEHRLWLDSGIHASDFDNDTFAHITDHPLSRIVAGQCIRASHFLVVLDDAVSSINGALHSSIQQVLEEPHYQLDRSLGKQRSWKDAHNMIWYDCTNKHHTFMLTDPFGVHVFPAHQSICCTV